MNTAIDATRTPASMLLALAVTLALFYLMKSLIEVTEVQLDPPRVITIEMVKPLEMEALETISKTPKAPPEPEVEPTPPTILIPGETAVAIFEAPSAPNGVQDGPAFGGLHDGALLPVVRVEPAYPRRAQVTGIEGYVIVEFDVGPDGSVRNPRVIEHSPSGIFDAASLAAIQRFRYKPEVTNGQAMTVTGVRNKFTFQLGEG